MYTTFGGSLQKFSLHFTKDIGYFGVISEQESSINCHPVVELEELAKEVCFVLKERYYAREKLERN